MSRVVFVDGARVQLDASALLGQGGEAEVYDLGDGRVLKWWKPPDHPDYDGLPAARAQATRRLAEQPARLRALPGNLPAAVVTPSGLALAGKRSSQVVGYVMRKVRGEPLGSYGEPRWRREHPVDGNEVVAALRSMHAAITGLHRAGVVVGDCNDLNVLVDGREVRLIDVDSYQLPGFPCAMFTERFVDPRLCDATGALVRPHDTDSDWFAFAVMVLRSLVLVGPWGGVHQPADVTQRCLPTARAARRLSVLGSDIIYPRAARPLAILPDELVETLRAIFERDHRGVFPCDLLERLRLRTCSSCGEEHARTRCPRCATSIRVPPAVVHGRLRWHRIALADVVLPYAVTRDRSRAVWLDGGGLWRHGLLGPERIGDVLAGQTRAWVSGRSGVGFYRAGGYAVGFVFRPDRGRLDDRVALPRIRGRLVDAHATLDEGRAWLWLVTDDAGRLATTCVVIAADARVLATETIADAPWLAGIHGACAANGQLFVPTDDGLVRVEVTPAGIAQTRVFAETAALITSADRIALSPSGDGIDAIRRSDAIRMQLA